MFQRAIAMRRFQRVLVLAALAVGVREAGAQFLSVSGSPPLLRVQSAIAGFAPTPVTNASTSYALLNFGGTTRKIVAQINQIMPAGTTLTVTLAALPGATSAGSVVLNTVAKDVVTGITGFMWTSRAITYQLSATLAAGVVPVQSRTVTLTIVAGS